MPDQPGPLTAEELDALDIVCGEPHPHGECLSCEADMSIKPGDEPTPLCHDCAHEVIQDVPRLVAMARLSLTLRRRVEELETELRERDRELLHRNTPRFAKDRP